MLRSRKSFHCSVLSFARPSITDQECRGSIAELAEPRSPETAGRPFLGNRESRQGNSTWRSKCRSSSSVVGKLGYLQRRSHVPSDFDLDDVTPGAKAQETVPFRPSQKSPHLRRRTIEDPCPRRCEQRRTPEAGKRPQQRRIGGSGRRHLRLSPHLAHSTREVSRLRPGRSAVSGDFADHL
jgi:hypothetical protein